MSPYRRLGLPAGAVPAPDRPVVDVLRTARLVLRPVRVDDVDLLYALHNDPDVMRHLNGGAHTPREAIAGETLPAMLARAAAHPGYGYWMATVDDGFIGWFSLCRLATSAPGFGDAPGFGGASGGGVAELGYRLHRAAWGLGYATEGARALIDRGFEAGLGRVMAQTMAVNYGSRRVMEKAGLRHVRTFHLEWEDPLPGTEFGEVEYALDRADWLAGPVS